MFLDVTSSNEDTTHQVAASILAHNWVFMDPKKRNNVYEKFFGKLKLIMMLFF